MNVDTVTAIVSDAIEAIILGSLPSVGLGLLVGLIIAIFQAITQIQEQTLTFVPKMVAVLVVLAATFPWMSRLLMDFTLVLWNNLPLYSQ